MPKNAQQFFPNKLQPKLNFATIQTTQYLFFPCDSFVSLGLLLFQSFDDLCIQYSSKLSEKNILLNVIYTNAFTFKMKSQSTTLYLLRAWDDNSALMLSLASSSSSSAVRITTPPSSVKHYIHYLHYICHVIQWAWAYYTILSLML